MEKYTEMDEEIHVKGENRWEQPWERGDFNRSSQTKEVL